MMEVKVNVCKGEVVRVYEDPLTRQKFEGEAKIVSVDPDLDNAGLRYCQVKFSGERTSYWRWVGAEDVVTPRCVCGAMLAQLSNKQVCTVCHTEIPKL